MGYTHYYQISNKGNEERFKKAKEDIIKILKKSPVKLGDGGGDRPISKEDYSSYISFNGIGDNSHETFYLPDKLSDLKQPDYAKDKNDIFVFNFTKTAHKPYDVVVTACLTVLRFHLRSGAIISGDGGEEGFEEGMKLAASILGRQFPNPCYELENSVEFMTEEK
jgi:hypothetical protein